MKEYLYIAVIYLIIISLAAVIVTIYDKAAAKGRKRRVPELWLFIIAALGGSAAMYFTMLTIRHKTRHVSFMAGIPAIMTVQIIIIAFLISKNV